MPTFAHRKVWGDSTCPIRFGGLTSGDESGSAFLFLFATQQKSHRLFALEANIFHIILALICIFATFAHRSRSDGRVERAAAASSDVCMRICPPSRSTYFFLKGSSLRLAYTYEPSPYLFVLTSQAYQRPHQKAAASLLLFGRFGVLSFWSADFLLKALWFRVLPLPLQQNPSWGIQRQRDSFAVCLSRLGFVLC